MTNKNRILVIHPLDPTTDFLKVIYEKLDCTVINENISDHSLRMYIKTHDTIIMLGHGFPGGLYGHNKIMINSNHVDLLKTKKLVGIWCFANKFFESNGLLGIYSDMIISELGEAYVFGVPCTQSELDVSNFYFAQAVKEAIASETPVEIFKQLYRSTDNPVIMWNQDNFYYAYEVYQL